jgi:hypothetical protein
MFSPSLCKLFHWRRTKLITLHHDLCFWAMSENRALVNSVVYHIELLSALFDDHFPQHFKTHPRLRQADAYGCIRMHTVHLHEETPKVYDASWLIVAGCHVIFSCGNHSLWLWILSRSFSQYLFRTKKTAGELETPEEDVPFLLTMGWITLCFWTCDIVPWLAPVVPFFGATSKGHWTFWAIHFLDAYIYINVYIYIYRYR